MMVNVEKISDAARTNEISPQTIDQIVIKVDGSDQDENKRWNNFDKLRETLLREKDKDFLELLRTGHYNTENGIPKGSNGETPLHLVCAEGRVRLTKKLLGYGKKKLVDYSDAMKMYDQTMGFTPFLTAAMNGHHQCFQILLRKLLRSLQTNAFNGHDILSLFNSDSEKQSRCYCLSSLVLMERRTNLLHIVAQQQHVKILECFINAKDGAKLYSDVIKPMLMAFDPAGSTPLHLAARLNHSEIVKQLFELAILCANLSHTPETSTKKDSNESEEDQRDDDDDEEDDDVYKSVDTNHSNINTRNTNSSANLAGRNSSTLSGANLSQRSTQTPIMKQSIRKKVSEIYATLIMKQNAYQCAPIHEAVQEGHKEMVEQFINVAVFHQQEILTIKNKDGQTALHLAALKGHVEIVGFILKHIDKKNIILKDHSGSTPLHCAAQASKKNHDNSAKILRQFIEVQKRWIKASEWLSESSVDLLKERNNLGYNCLEEAIINKNRPFVECIFDLNSTQWKVLMQNAQISDKVPEVNTPMRKLIKYMPDMACQVFTKCIEKTIIPNEPNEPKKKKLTYDFQFLEDHCHVQHWKYSPKNKFQKRDQSKLSDKANLYWQKFQKSLYSITFRNNSETHDEPLTPFSNSPRTLVNNHPLSTIINNLSLSGILDERNVKSQTRLLEHPLCHQLSLFKWKQFGLYIFFISFFTYVLFLGLFTWATLRNIEPRKFYDAVNVSYGNIDSGRPSVGCKEVLDLLNARDDQSIKALDHRKDQTDYVLKYILYILLWLHILKGVLMIGVYRLRIRGRFYAEVIALILCFIYLYDDPDWQKDTRFRCVDQWQTGAFGLFLAWSTLLAYIRFIPYFGLYVVMLEVIINKFLWFAPVLIILICSFAFPFYMLLQNQVPFQNVPFAWLRSAFMLTDMGYEARFYGSDGQHMIVLYPVLIALFIFYGVTVYILVTNLLIGLAVGEIPTLVQLSRLHGLIIQNEFLNTSEIFRLQYLCTPSKIYFTEEIIESIDPNGSTGRLKWLRRFFHFRPAHPTDDTLQD